MLFSSTFASSEKRRNLLQGSPHMSSVAQVERMRRMTRMKTIMKTTKTCLRRHRPNQNLFHLDGRRRLMQKGECSSSTTSTGVQHGRILARQRSKIVATAVLWPHSLIHFRLATSNYLAHCLSIYMLQRYPLCQGSSCTPCLNKQKNGLTQNTANAWVI